MLSTLDINDHDNIKMARGMIDQISEDEWKEYVSFDNKLFSYDDKGFLTKMSYEAKKTNRLTPPQVFKALGLVEKIDKIRNRNEGFSNIQTAMSVRVTQACWSLEMKDVQVVVIQSLSQTVP